MLEEGLIDGPGAAQLLKNETLKITYSYWDGQGHRRVATVKKGDTVKDFLQKVKEQLIPEFRELRCMPTSSGHPWPCRSPMQALHTAAGALLTQRKRRLQAFPDGL